MILVSSYAGVDIVTLANNHLMDHGEEVFNETIDTLNELNISITGVTRDIPSPQVNKRYTIATGNQNADRT